MKSKYEGQVSEICADCTLCPPFAVLIVFYVLY